MGREAGPQGTAPACSLPGELIKAPPATEQEVPLFIAISTGFGAFFCTPHSQDLDKKRRGVWYKEKCFVNEPRLTLNVHIYSYNN